MQGKIHNVFQLLCEGHSLTKIAHLTGLSIKTIHKHAKNYERRGLIQMISKYPSQYQKAGKILPPYMPVGDFTPPTPHTSTILPKKFGASFKIIMPPNQKRLPLIYNAWGKARLEKYTHNIEFGRHIAKIWLKAGFVNARPDEVVKYGTAQMIAIASDYAKKFNIKLTFIRVYPDIEWVDVDAPRSQDIAEKAGIGNGGMVEVEGAIHKFNDSSDPEHFQIVAKPKGNPVMPTLQANTHHFLYSGELERTLEAIGSSIIGLNQGMIELKNRRG